MKPALNWLRIRTARASCQIPGGIAVAGLAMNSRRTASQVSTRTTGSERGSSLARAVAAPRVATKARVSSLFMADVIIFVSAGPGPAQRFKQGAVEFESADWRWFRGPPVY